MSKKKKYNVNMKRSDKDLSEWRKDPFGKMQKMNKRIPLIIAILFVITIIFIYFRTKVIKDTLDRIEVKVSADKLANMPLDDAEDDFSVPVLEETFMDPVESDGEPLSGYASVSFNTDDGLYAMYDGYFEKGLFNGQGSYTKYYLGTNTVKSTYNGEWEDSLANGTGTSKSFYENGKMKVLSVGNWKDGQLNGDGEYTEFSSSGVVIVNYSGGFLNGEFNGNGKFLKYAESGQALNFVYEGTIKDSKWAGTGTATEYYEDGKTVKFVRNGNWKNGQLNGDACEYTTFSSSGEIILKYSGGFLDNKFNGTGTATGYYEDGMTIKWRFDSQWKNGFPDGDGTFAKYDKDDSILTAGTITGFTDENGMNRIESTVSQSITEEFKDFFDTIMDISGYPGYRWEED